MQGSHYRSPLALISHIRRGRRHRRRYRIIPLHDVLRVRGNRMQGSIVLKFTIVNSDRGRRVEGEKEKRKGHGHAMPKRKT